MDALDRAYHAFSTQAQLSGAAAIDAVRAIDQAAHPFDHVVSFPIARAPSDLRLVAARVLNSLVRRWLRVNGNHFLRPFVRPEHIEAGLSPGGARLSDLVAELGSPAAVFEEVNAQLPYPSYAEGSPNPLIDRFFARLFAAIGPSLPEGLIDDFLRESIRRRLPNVCAVLAWSLAATGAAIDKIIDNAQKLKSAGYSQFAYDFMRPDIPAMRALRPG